jgi:hypothetical protein
MEEFPDTGEMPTDGKGNWRETHIIRALSENFSTQPRANRPICFQSRISG